MERNKLSLGLSGQVFSLAKSYEHGQRALIREPDRSSTTYSENDRTSTAEDRHKLGSHENKDLMNN